MRKRIPWLRSSVLDTESLDYADLVIGSRNVPDGRTPVWGLSRRLISGFGN